MVDLTLPHAAPSGLYDQVQLRDIEQRAQALLAPHTLMRRAGQAAADLAQQLVAPTGSAVSTVLIVAGPGNNGGDACECGFHLARLGWSVTLWMPLPSPKPGPDAAQALARIRGCMVRIIESADAVECAASTAEVAAEFAAQSWSLVVDGLFGIGLTRPLNGALRGVVATMNAIAAPVLALDVPSGLNADTGAIPTDENQASVCVRATHTLSFIADKPGLHTGDGRDHAGLVSVASLDIDPALLPQPYALLSQPGLFATAAKPRAHASHKGTYGDVMIIGGGAGMVGAALLAGHAALKAGSGRVLIGFADRADAPHYDPLYPELMCRAAASLDFKQATLVVGPGLGMNAAASELVMRACASDVPLVLDADALNLVAGSAALAAALQARAGRSLATLLTPHPLEAARLLGTTATRVQADRLSAAGSLARRFGATVILKGSGTVIADGGWLAINPTGNPALATGGTGDVQAGLCGALLAQGWPLREAALGAVWMHGEAADQLVASGIGPIGVTASEIIDAVRAVLNALVRMAGTGVPVYRR